MTTAEPPATATPDVAAARPIRATWEDRLGRYAMRALQILIIGSLIAAALWLVMTLRAVVIPVLLALLLAAAFKPLVTLFCRLHLPRALAAVASLLVGGGAIGAVIAFIVMRVEGQWKTLVSAANSGVAQLQKALVNGPIDIDQAQLDRYRSDVVQYLTSAQFGTNALAGLVTAAEAITTTLVLIITLFFLLKDGDRIAAFLTGFLDEERSARAHRIGLAAVHSLGGYVRGTALIAFIDASLIGGGLFFLNVPLAFALAVLVFIGAFVPIVGATIAGTIAVLVALVTNGFSTAIAVLVVVLVVNQMEAHLLQPLIMGRTVELYPLVVLLALLVGSIGAGIFGAIVAVPVTAVIWDAIRLWDVPEEPTEVHRSRRRSAGGAVVDRVRKLGRAVRPAH